MFFFTFLHPWLFALSCCLSQSAAFFFRLLLLYSCLAAAASTVEQLAALLGLLGLPALLFLLLLFHCSAAITTALLLLPHLTLDCASSSALTTDGCQEEAPQDHFFHWDYYVATPGKVEKEIISQLIHNVNSISQFIYLEKEYLDLS